MPSQQGGYWRTFDSTMGLLLPKLERQHNALAAQSAASAPVQPAAQPVIAHVTIFFAASNYDLECLRRLRFS